MGRQEPERQKAIKTDLRDKYIGVGKNKEVQQAGKRRQKGKHHHKNKNRDRGTTPYKHAGRPTQKIKSPLAKHLTGKERGMKPALP